MSLLDEVAGRLGALPKAVPMGPRVPSCSVHTLYWGAHHFHAGSLRSIGEEARAVWSRYAATLGWDDVTEAVTAKLAREPVEDLRVDFEDGFAGRTDDEEDAAAAAAGAAIMQPGAAPPRCGVRTKALTAELAPRAIRTLELFAEAAGGLPAGFVVTLPKVTEPEQLRVAEDVLTALERKSGVPQGTIELEIMVEVPQALFDREGRLRLPSLIAAGGDRLAGVHLGVYDLSAAWEVPAVHQSMDHAACDFVRSLIRLTGSGTGLTLSAGSTNQLPVEGHVLSAWEASHQQIRHTLVRGFYHGWDLHPAQLPIRFATNFRFYREGLPAALERLSAWTGAADGGSTLDDAPTVAALLGFVRRAVACGAAVVDELPREVAELLPPG